MNHLWCPKIGRYPQSSSIYRWIFHYKPSILRGTCSTPIDGNHHILIYFTHITLFSWLVRWFYLKISTWKGEKVETSWHVGWIGKPFVQPFCWSSLAFFCFLFLVSKIMNTCFRDLSERWVSFPAAECTRGVHSQARLPRWRWRQTNRSARCGPWWWWRWLLRFVGFAPAGCCLNSQSRCFFLQIPDETWDDSMTLEKTWIVAVGSLMTKLQSPVF